MRGEYRTLLILVMLGGLAACGSGSGDAVEAAVHHPLAGPLAAVRDRLQGLDEQETRELDKFLYQAGPALSVYEVRRVCAAAGKGLRNSDPDVSAGFVLAAAPHLYDDFFAAFDEGMLAQIASSLRSHKEIDEIARLRMETIIRQGRGVYSGPLEQALAVVPFADAIAPMKLPLNRILPGEDAKLEQYVGAAEILRLEAFVEEGAKRDFSVETYRRALNRWENDTVLTAGLVTVYVENEERYGEELRFFLTKAEELDSRNAAYSYLRALRYFRTGRDEKAVVALKKGLSRTMVSFYGLVRARHTADALLGFGYGPIRARLASYRAASIGPFFDLKELANVAIRRSYEYAESGDEDKLDAVLQYPAALDRQMRGVPHMRFAELLRGAILTKGFMRMTEFHQTRNPGLATQYRDRADSVQRRLDAIDKGSELCGGQEAWGRLYDLLGEKGFLRFVDGVLLGNESEFLIACGSLKSLEEAKSLTERRYGFD